MGKGLRRSPENGPGHPAREKYARQGLHLKGKHSTEFANPACIGRIRDTSLLASGQTRTTEKLLGRVKCQRIQPMRPKVNDERCGQRRGPVFAGPDGCSSLFVLLGKADVHTGSDPHDKSLTISLRIALDKRTKIMLSKCRKRMSKRLKIVQQPDRGV